MTTQGVWRVLKKRCLTMNDNVFAKLIDKIVEEISERCAQKMVIFLENKSKNKLKVKPRITFPDGRLTVKDAAIYLGFKDKTLAMMRSNGTGPKFIKRGRIFYYEEDLKEWLKGEGVSISVAQENFKNLHKKMEKVSDD